MAEYDIGINHIEFTLGTLKTAQTAESSFVIVRNED